MKHKRFICISALLLTAAAGCFAVGKNISIESKQKLQTEEHEIRYDTEETALAKKFGEKEQISDGSHNNFSVKLKVDGKEADFSDEQAMVWKGWAAGKTLASSAVLIPVTRIRDTFSAACYKLEDQLIIEKYDKVFSFQEEILTIKGEEYLPIDLLAETLEYKISWQQEEQLLSLESMDPKKKIYPEKYDYREKGRMPEVKNQGELGTCWAFASLTALESSLMPEEELHFSEDHMSRKNSFQMEQDEGGEYTMSMAYLLARQGPVLEEDDPYGDGVSPDGLKPVKSVQEIRLIRPKDYDGIKKAVFLYGGVQSSLYTSMNSYKSRSVYYNEDNNAYCYMGQEKPNHDSVIIGWDDSYPKENFNIEVEGDGAFICVNSWGEEFGDHGFFYVSYYDTNIGASNIVYTGIEDYDEKSYLYQADLCGWNGQLGFGTEDAWFANVYQAERKELLTAVGFYAIDENTSYQVYVETGTGENPDFQQKIPVADGSFYEAGYYTVPLKEEIPLEKGQRFSVIIYITTPGAIHPVAIEYQEGTRGKADLSDGEGYVSLDGKKWARAEEEQQCNLCLKAYTKVQ